MENKSLFVSMEDTIAYAMQQIDKNGLGNVLVLQDGKLAGVISDGDIRRFLMKNNDIYELVNKVANRSPVYLYENQLTEKEHIMKEKKIAFLPVVNYNMEVKNVVTLQESYTVKKETRDIPVVIMAGGKGTRLYPYTRILPKPLIPMGDKTIAELIINQFEKYGSKEVYMILNHKKNMIKSYFDYAQQECELHFVEEEQFLGTGGGLSLLKKYSIQEFFLTNCDIIIDADYDKIYRYHKEEGNFITLICARKESKIPYGVVRLDGHLYGGMKEKPSYEVLINTGVYLVDGQVIKDMDDDVVIDFPTIIDHYKKKNKKIGVYVINEEAFMDMGQMAELEQMKKKLKLAEE